MSAPLNNDANVLAPLLAFLRATAAAAASPKKQRVMCAEYIVRFLLILCWLFVFIIWISQNSMLRGTSKRSEHHSVTISGKNVIETSAKPVWIRILTMLAFPERFFSNISLLIHCSSLLGNLKLGFAMISSSLIPGSRFSFSI